MSENTTTKVDIRAVLVEAIAVIDKTADQMDVWAQSSINGGWSTHQVDANRKQAEQLRRRSAEFRRALTQGCQ